MPTILCLKQYGTIIISNPGSTGTVFWWLYGRHDGCDGGNDSGDCLDASSDDFKCSADGGGVKSAI